ncbi:MAG: tetratricopeptide repeat protein [Bdellovibrionales bacterium]|nr:tetratricopeptide repeat protein [Bdellovibrionales bacterium]
MVEENNSDLINEAQKFFEKGKYNQAESILNQLILRNHKEPLIFHMLGTIYYDRGKFNKAVRAFKRALEIDPGFTDASVGLSIILNDLGRYDEGKHIFDEAHQRLEKKKQQTDPYINEKFAIKHDELGELYSQYKKYNDALEQFYKARNLSSRKAEISLKIVDCYQKLGADQKAIKELEKIIQAFPSFETARLRLAKIYVSKNQRQLARQQWEKVLENNPENKKAKDLLRQLDSGKQIELT